jgi:hypothetical protein
MLACLSVPPWVCLFRPEHARPAASRLEVRATRAPWTLLRSRWSGAASSAVSQVPVGKLKLQLLAARRLVEEAKQAKQALSKKKAAAAEPAYIDDQGRRRNASRSVRVQLPLHSVSPRAAAATWRRPECRD